MKIALVNNYYYLRGGSERVLFGDEAALRALGHQVLPFSVHDERNEKAATADWFSAIPDPQRPGLRNQVRAGVGYVYAPAIGRDFGAFLDRFQPEVVHCHNIYGRLTTAVLDQAQRRSIPVVLTVHDQKLVCPAYVALRQGQPCQLCQDGGYWRCLRWKCHKNSLPGSLIYTVESYANRWLNKYNSVNRFLCPSNFLRESLIRCGVEPHRTVYHPNALPVSDYDPACAVGDYILYAGRLSEEKGLRTLLRAARHLPLPLRIAGTGPLEKELREETVRRQLPVTFDGYQSGAALRDLFRQAAFSVVPSEWFENASMAVLESFAYGKPVLATAIGGNPELVVDGETGSLFPPGDADALAKAAQQLLSDQSALEQMARNARRLIEQRFNQRQRTEALIRIYQQLVAERI